MGFVKVAVTSDVPKGKMKKIAADGYEILLCNIEGAYYAISNKCPHMGGSLADGILENGVITCPRHGSKFDVKTGKSVGNAKVAFVSMKVKDAQSYPVKTEGIDIMVNFT